MKKYTKGCVQYYIIDRVCLIESFLFPIFFFKIIRHAWKTYIVRREKAIIKVYEYFKLEAERGRLRIRVLDYAKRT